MERLTGWDKNNAFFAKCFDEPCLGSGCRFVDCELNELVCTRLAAYEDLGVTPEQIKEIDRLYAEKCREVVELKRYKWIPVDERLPEDKVNPITRDAYVYPVTVDLGGATDIRYYSFCRGHWYNQGPKEMDELVMAWQERPEPYNPE